MSKRPMFYIGSLPLHVFSTKMTTANLSSAAAISESEVRVARIPVERIQDVIDHQRRSFFHTEPMNIALDVTKNADAMQKLITYCKKSVAEGISVMAVNSKDELVGAHVTGTLYPGDMEKLLAEVSPNPQGPYEKIMYFVAKVNVEAKLFERYKVDKIFEMRMASMDKDYRGLSVGQKAILLDEKIAREAGFKLIKTEASSIFSAKVLVKMGYKILTETPYDSVLDQDGKVMVPCKPPHNSMLILVKELD